MVATGKRSMNRKWISLVLVQTGCHKIKGKMITQEKGNILLFLLSFHKSSFFFPLKYVLTDHKINCDH